MLENQTLKVFKSQRFIIEILRSPDGTCRLQWFPKNLTSEDGAIAFNSFDAFELSRLLRRAASFVEWIEDYGIESVAG